MSAFDPDALRTNFDPETRAHWAQLHPHMPTIDRREHAARASGVEVFNHHGRVK